MGIVVAVFLLITGIPLDAQQQVSSKLPDIPNPAVADLAPEIGKFGGTFVVSAISDPRTFNPVVVQDTASSAVTDLIFDNLVQSNYVTGEIVPALAESWSVSRDGRTWTFTLREGVRWRDGKPLTIDDVVFSLETIFTPGVEGSTKDQLRWQGKQLRWKKLDARRIQLITPSEICPVGLFPSLISGLDVIPKHKLADVLAKGAAEFNKTWGINADGKDIVGTGPYVLQSYVPGQRVTMLRNSTYWTVDKKGNRLPYLLRYVILTVPSIDAARLKFLAGETDTYGALAREYAELKQQEKAGNFTIHDGPEGFGSEFLVLNQNPAGVSPPKLTWFQDVRFRRALNHAVDRATIVQQVNAGRATPAWSPVSVGNKLYLNDKVVQYPYNLDRAQQLLAEAGYRKGPDGFLRDAQNNIVEFTLSTNAGNTTREAIGNILRQDFTKLGIRATFAPESFPSLVGKLTGTYKWEAIIIGLTGGIEPGTGRNVWLSSGDLHMFRPNQTQPATAWEAEIDKIFEAVACEVDQNKRKVLYARWQEIVATEVPFMYFANPKTQPALRNTLGNTRLGLAGVTGELITRYYKGAFK
jgi:peptide/nickel transport system substrate-binding protein